MPVPFRADHVGSLLQPRALLDARRDADVTAATLKRLEDAAILTLARWANQT